MISKRKFLKSGFLGLSALGLNGFIHKPLSASTRGIVGKKAPELDVGYWIDSKGDETTFKLSDHEGKWVFLECFQSWCPGCHSHGLPTLKKVSEEFKGNPKIVFACIQTVFEGFNTNTQSKVRETQLQYELDMVVGHDAGSEGEYPSTMKDYRTGGTPWVILINPSGDVVYNEFSLEADKAIAFFNEKIG